MDLHPYSRSKYSFRYLAQTTTRLARCLNQQSIPFTAGHLIQLCDLKMGDSSHSITTLDFEMPATANMFFALGLRRNIKSGVNFFRIARRDQSSPKKDDLVTYSTRANGL